MVKISKMFKINRKSILVNLIFSYILILVASLCIYFPTINTSKNVLKKEVENNYTASINQLKLSIDKRITDVENIGTEISINKKLQNIMMQGYPLDDYDSYQILDIINQLHSWRVVNMFIEDIDIYLPNSDLILSDSSSYNYNDWYNIYYKNIKGMGNGKLRDYLRQYHARDYMPMSKLNSSGNEYKFISYTHSIAINSNKKSNGTLFISIKESFIKDLLNSYDFIAKKGNAFIMDNNNNIISSTNDFKLPEKFNYGYISSQKNMIDVKVNNKSYRIVHAKSDVNNWIYCFVIPDSVFFQRLDALTTINTISIGFCLFLGVVIMYYFVKKNYTPIEGIIKLFSKLDCINNEDSDDEYKYLQTIANNIISENEKMHDKINSNKLELINNFLVKLLRGRIDNEEDYTKLCREYDLKLNNGKFAVILVTPQKVDDLKFDKNTQMDTIEVLQFMIKNTFEELINEKNIGYAVEADNRSVCIVNIKMDDSDETDKVLLKYAEETQKIMSIQYGIDICVSISSAHISYKGIADAYKEAAETMEYQLLTGDVEILGYKTIKNYSDALIVKDFENNKKLKNCIETGEFSNAKTVINTIFNNSFYDKKNPTSLYALKARMYGLINVIIESMYDITAKYDYDFFQNINTEKIFLKCDNLTMLHREMNKILDYADNYVKSRKVAKNDNLLDKILEFISLNYSNNNLSVGMISEEFGFTVPYISKFFKKKMGKGLLDYIHSVRIEHAKELLKEGGLQIKDVAEMLGYYNTVAFIRVFKKFEGISPGKYGEGGSA